VAFTLLLFLLPAALIEGKGPVAAMCRSAQLGSGYGTRTFGCLLLLGTVLSVISLGIRLPLGYLLDGVLNVAPGASRLIGGDEFGSAPSAQAQVVSLLSTGLAHMLLIPFLVSVVVVLYYDLCIRKEGYDMDLLAGELEYPALSTLRPFLPPVAVFGPQRPGLSAPPKRAGRKP